jgi:hypothetical protein
MLYDWRYEKHRYHAGSGVFWLSFCLLAVLHLVKIAGVDPFLGKAAIKADIAVDVDRGEYGRAGLYVVAES